MTNNMVMVWRHGLMAVDTKAITIWGRKVEKENMFGKMEVITKEIG